MNLKSFKTQNYERAERERWRLSVLGKFVPRRVWLLPLGCGSFIFDTMYVSQGFNLSTASLV